MILVLFLNIWVHVYVLYDILNYVSTTGWPMPAARADDGGGRRY